VRKRSLGKGLSELIPSGPINDSRALLEVPIDALYPNPMQPRADVDPDRLEELTLSIEAHGVLQPIIVRKKGNDYEIVAGERRWRAAQRAGLETVPCITQEITDEESLQLALIENLQREDLNPLEEAQAFSFLLREHELTHEQLAERLGCSRPAISNSLRLLTLPEEIRADLEAGILSPGHARAVLSLEEDGQRLAAWRILRERGMSVRQAEELVSRLAQEGKSGKKPPRAVEGLSPDWEEVVDQLQRDLGTEVRIHSKANGRGRLELHYRDRDELERLVELLVYLGEREASRPSALY